MSFYDDSCDECTVAELRAEATAQRRYLAALARHPDPRVPDYPGDLPDDEQEDH